MERGRGGLDAERDNRYGLGSSLTSHLHPSLNDFCFFPNATEAIYLLVFHSSSLSSSTATLALLLDFDTQMSSSSSSSSASK